MMMDPQGYEGYAWIPPPPSSEMNYNQQPSANETTNPTAVGSSGGLSVEEAEQWAQLLNATLRQHQFNGLAEAYSLRDIPDLKVNGLDSQVGLFGLTDYTVENWIPAQSQEALNFGRANLTAVEFAKFTPVLMAKGIEILKASDLFYVTSKGRPLIQVMWMKVMSPLEFAQITNNAWNATLTPSSSPPANLATLTPSSLSRLPTARQQAVSSRTRAPPSSPSPPPPSGPSIGHSSQRSGTSENSYPTKRSDTSRPTSRPKGFTQPQEEYLVAPREGSQRHQAQLHAVNQMLNRTLASANLSNSVPQL